MKTTSRRTMLRTLLAAPAALALGELGCNTGTKSLATTGSYFNLYLQGPFSLLFFQKKVVVVAPIADKHHEPSMTSDMAETVVTKSKDYRLEGPNPASQSSWQYPDSSVTVGRLNIAASILGMDKGGVVDSGKTKRYFSLEVPTPDIIIPRHPVNILVTGKNSPFSAKTLLPVGYIFSYKDTDLSKVNVKCPTNSLLDWNPRLSPVPNQSNAEVIVEMTSTLDIDSCHQVAIDSFAVGRDLYQGVNTGAILDLGLSYPDDPSCCHPKDKPLINVKPIPLDCNRAHTGADCKAAILEITGVSDNVTMG